MLIMKTLKHSYCQRSYSIYLYFRYDPRFLAPLHCPRWYHSHTMDHRLQPED